MKIVRHVSRDKTGRDAAGMRVALELFMLRRFALAGRGLVAGMAVSRGGGPGRGPGR